MKSPPSDAALVKIAERFRLLGEPTRLKLLSHLCQGECSVNILAKQTGLTQTNASRQLQALTRAGFLRRRKEGLNVYYEMRDTRVLDLCHIVCDCMELHLKEQLCALQPTKKKKRKGV